MTTDAALLSLVLPVYNEIEVLPHLAARLDGFLASLGMKTEVIFVDDGSEDGSGEYLTRLAAVHPEYRVVRLSRNFGHQTAITAGLDHAEGDAVVVMDADLQDPPEIVGKMLAKWYEGYDVVYAVRTRREGDTTFKRITARLFYRLIARMVSIKIPLDAGDFRLMSRRVVLTLRALTEQHRFVRGLVSWVGFRQTAVSYERPARLAGETKYPLAKMLRFAVDGIASFSGAPLRLAFYFSLLSAFASAVVLLWSLYAFFFLNTVRGWTSLIAIFAFFSSAQFLAIGILGEYIGRIFEQVKERPLYIVAETSNIARTHSSAGANAKRDVLGSQP